MDSLEPQPHQPELLSAPESTAHTTVEIDDLRQQCMDLRTLFNAALSGLILLSLAANLVFGKQMLIVRRQIEEQRPNFIRAEKEFRQNREPEMRRFVDELHRYSATHPDFRTTVLDRYRVALAQYFTAGTAQAEATPTPIPQPQGTAPALSRPPGK